MKTDNKKASTWKASLIFGVCFSLVFVSMLSILLRSNSHFSMGKIFLLLLLLPPISTLSFQGLITVFNKLKDSNL